MQSVKFKKPPLIEVVFGINIEMSELSLIHFGLYWETIKSKFPTPVEFVGELTLTEDVYYTPSFPTVCYLSSDENRLIRLTDDYFSFHCRCMNEDYQHFEKLFQEFLTEWNNLESWWSDIGQKDIKIEKFSLQYINLIDEESAWKSLKDNGKVFSIFNQDIETSLGLPKAYSSELEFNLPNDSGRLIIVLEQKEVKNSADEIKNMMIFSLLAISSQVEKSSQSSWFCSAHDSIIQSFLDLTTEEAQGTWGRIYE